MSAITQGWQTAVDQVEPALDLLRLPIDHEGEVREAGGEVGPFSFASVGLAKGVPVTDVAAWLGHSDLRTTYQTSGHVRDPSALV